MSPDAMMIMQLIMFALLGGATFLLVWSLAGFLAKKPRKLERDIRDVKELLGLDPNGNEFNVVKGAFSRSADEMAILSRSVMEIMRAMAGYIDVPIEDIEDGWVTPPLPETFENEAGFSQLFRVSSGKQEPEHAFTSVKYRDHWFWIDGRDLYSKRVLSFLMILFNLAETRGPSKAPLVTIPTG